MQRSYCDIISNCITSCINVENLLTYYVVCAVSRRDTRRCTRPVILDSWTWWGFCWSTVLQWRLLPR